MLRKFRAVQALKAEAIPVGHLRISALVQLGIVWDAAGKRLPTSCNSKVASAVDHETQDKPCAPAKVIPEVEHLLHLFELKCAEQQWSQKRVAAPQAPVEENVEPRVPAQPGKEAGVRGEVHQPDEAVEYGRNQEDLHPAKKLHEKPRQSPTSKPHPQKMLKPKKSSFATSARSQQQQKMSLPAEDGEDHPDQWRTVSRAKQPKQAVLAKDSEPPPPKALLPSRSSGLGPSGPSGVRVIPAKAGKAILPAFPKKVGACPWANVRPPRVVFPRGRMEDADGSIGSCVDSGGESPPPAVEKAPKRRPEKPLNPLAAPFLPSWANPAPKGASAEEFVSSCSERSTESPFPASSPHTRWLCPLQAIVHDPYHCSGYQYADAPASVLLKGETNGVSAEDVEKRLTIRCIPAQY